MCVGRFSEQHFARQLHTPVFESSGVNEALKHSRSPVLRTHELAHARTQFATRFESCFATAPPRNPKKGPSLTITRAKKSPTMKLSWKHPKEKGEKRMMSDYKFLLKFFFFFKSQTAAWRAETFQPYNNQSEL